MILYNDQIINSLNPALTLDHVIFCLLEDLTLFQVIDPCINHKLVHFIFNRTFHTMPYHMHSSNQ